jgi:4-amino-4-deoxy-L-arabinose transferase-like glycosyltransferase
LGRNGSARFLGLFYAGVVLALWTKGLIGPVLIGAGLATYAALSRSFKILAPLRPVAGAVIVLAAIGSLAAAIAASGGEPALRTWFWVNHVERFTHPVATGHERPFAYYLWTLPIAIAPWLIPFLALLRLKGPLWRRDRADAALLRFAAAMTLGPVVVLSLASSKREVYLLPLLPALALLMATSVRDRIESERRSERPGAWTRAGDWTQAAILGAVGVAPAVAHILVTGTVTTLSAVFLTAGLAAAAALGVSVARRDLGRAFWIGAASMGLALAGVFALVVPRVDAIKDLAPFIASIDRILPAGEPVRAIGADETLLGIVPFVTGRTVIPIEPNDLGGTAFVLVQSNDTELDLGVLEPAYERVTSREFGPSRRMALWRRRFTRP